MNNYPTESQSNLRSDLPFTTQSLHWVVIFFLLYWSCVALTTHSSPPHPKAATTIQLTPFQPLIRDQIHQALNGDTTIMKELILSWNEESPHLTQEEFTFVQTWQEEVIASQKRIFPHSYAAASFMLALTPSDWIMALPEGLRYQTELFSPEITSAITKNTNTYDAEKLYLCPPDLTFVATYSNPQFIQTLNTLDIPFCYLNNEMSCAGIQKSILKVGEKIGCENRARLMALFVKSALEAIDKRFYFWNKEHPDFHPVVTFYDEGWSLPTTQSLTGELISRANLNCALSSSYQWYEPCNLEAIHTLNPDKLIIVSSPDLKTNLPPFTTSLIDRTLQKSPTQHIVLAYFDLLSAVVS